MLNFDSSDNRVSSLSDSAVISVENLSRNYGLKTVFRDVSFQVRSGEVFGLLGANGAGKSTLLKLLARLSRPTSGTIKILDQDIWDLKDDLLPEIGYLGHLSGLYHDLSPEENLRFFSKALGRNGTLPEIQEILGSVGLLSKRNQPLKQFSRGMIQRCAVARLILQNPSVLLLDEPFTGLDQEGQEFLENFILNASKEGKGIVLVSHNLQRLWSLCSSFGILKNGLLYYKGEKSSLSQEKIKEAISGTN